MIKKISISKIAGERTILFMCAVTLLCQNLLAEELGYCQFISKKTVVVDHYYMALMNDKGTDNSLPDQALCCAVRTTGTQDVYKVWVPSEIDYAYQIELFDNHSNSVTKTDLGKKVGNKFYDMDISSGYIKPESKPQLTGAFTEDKVSSGWYVVFRASDYFEITNSGDYNLRVRLQMVGPTGNETNRLLQIVRFPPLDFPIKKQ